MVQPAFAAPSFPPLTGRVVDEAHLLSLATQAQLSQKLAELEAKTSRQLVVVTLSSLQGYDIADYGYQLGRAWGIGQKGLNNGVLFIIAPNERKTRIEVGYGLEGILTDALSSVILQERVLPRFRAGDFEGGIVAGTDVLIQQLTRERSEAERIAAEAEKRAEPSQGAPVLLFLFVLLGLWILFALLSRRGGVASALTWIILGSGGGRGDSDGSSSGGFGGGGSGGSFGGGGGSFGGGGASGSW
jgi:uncharacterized protein